MDKKSHNEMNRRSFLKTGFLLMCASGLSACEKGTRTVDEIINEGDNNAPGGNDNEPGGSTVHPFNFETRTVLLNSGYEMPILGIGTYRLSTSQAETSVYNALEAGMRLIDTADIYGNERGVARGIQRAMQDFGIRREEIFVTSKLWTSEFHRADEEVNERLEQLGLDYVDLLLLHHEGQDDEYAYQAMERGVAAGKLRSIGISNFYEEGFDRLMRTASIPPAILQNETHLYNQSRSIKAHIAPLGTVMESWFPLGGRGTGIRTLSGNETVMAIAAAHSKTPYQILLRWQLQTGNIAIPGSSHPEHIRENVAVFDFELTDVEKQELNDMDKQQRFASY